MTAVKRTTLYSYFLTGSRPTQQQFANLIDSTLNIVEVSGQAILSDVSALGSFAVSGAFEARSDALFRSNVNVSGSFSVNGAFSPATVSAGTLNISGQSSFNGATTLASAKGITPTLGSSSTDLATTAFCNPDSVIASTGSRKNSDGLIEKWGTSSVITSGGGNSVITFASAYPSGIFNIQITPIGLTSGFQADNFVTAVSAAAFTLQNQGGNSNAFYWRTLGN